MPEMKTYTVNGVTYDLRDPTKAPAGYGLGEQVFHTHRLSSMADLDNLNRTCYFALSLSSSATIHGVEFGVAHGRHLTYADGIHYQELIMIGVLYKFERYCYNGKWSEWYKTDPEAFAPAGYGLGTVQPIEWSNIDSITTNGWYSAVVNGEIASGAATYMAWVRVDALDTSFACQTAYITGGAYVLKRHRQAGAWGEWEWINPPMSLGVEYRTTERWQGMVVWTVLVDCGTAVAGENNISTNFACSRIIGSRGYMGGGAIPQTYDSARNDKYFKACNVSNVSGKIAIVLELGSAQASSAPCHVQVWYTKG